jgi:hypothetical protein
MTRRVVRSTRVPTAEPFRAPLRRSRLPSGQGPCGWPPPRGARPSASCWGSGRVGLSPATEAGGPGAPDAARPTARCAGLHAAAHTRRHRWSLSRVASACRQDTRVGDARQSVRANTPGPGGFGHTTRATGPGVCGVAVADAPGPPLRAAPCRLDTESRVRCACIRGSRCWGRAPTPSPSFAANSLGPVPGSALHVPRYSGACSIVLAWQHLSPSGPTALHLELELKQ